MANNSLIAIANSVQSFEDRIAKNEGEITEADEALLEQIKSDLQEKTTGVKAWLYKMQGDAETLLSIAKRYNDEANRVNKKLEKFEEYIIACMDKMEVIEIGGADKIKIKKPSQIIEIVNEDEIPLEYFETRTKTETIILKQQIKDALKEGKQIAGAKLSFGKRSLKY
jgi:hypothetical protein